YRYGMEAGNMLTVNFMMMLSACDRLTYGQNLDELYQTVEGYTDFLERIQSLANREIVIASVLQPIRQLLGLTSDVRSLDDNTFSEADFLEKYQSSDFALSWLYAIKIRHAVLLRDETAYEQLVDKLALIEATIATHAKVPSAAFYVALMHVWLNNAEEEAEKEKHTQAIAALEAKLTRWARACPENVEHKCLILAAEEARLNRQWVLANEKYDAAIALANQNRYYYEAAFAGELAAQLFFDWGKPRIAKEYLIDSYISYERWGAIAKLRQLQALYPDVLNSHIEQTASSHNMLGHSITGKDVISENLTVRESHGFGRTQVSGGSSVWAVSRASRSITSSLRSLDISALLKASQALSSEIQLDKLITTLLQTTLESAGANRCALLMPQKETSNERPNEKPNEKSSEAQPHALMVMAIAQNDSQFEIEHLAAELTSEQPLCTRIIQTVQRTLDTVIINNATTTPSLAADAYIAQHQPKSILCFPIQQSGRLSGILYLENRHTAHAFTPNHLEVLRIISTQAAISLENSLLYERQDALVQSRTQALTEALEDLKLHQIQLVQKEKMSSLGQLVAGIAHEINNPINFIYGNITSTRRYVEDLIALLNTYQASYPEPTDEVADIIEDLEIDFVTEDLSKTLASMKFGAQRIRDIVLSLRNFSRLDESEFKPVDIHEGVESALMLLQNKLKEGSDYGRIKVDKQYAELPKIHCFAGEINQVFFNLLTNAIDALRQKSGTGTDATEPPLIQIQTEQIDNDILIRFSDNGPGIAPHVQGKLFDPFFTTKPVGQGTGMGLAIAHQTITEKHKGELSFTSSIGQGSTFTVRLPILP
ncbi:MAG: ATP-binding protein, partial [Cyanobacteria bacterium J06632_3]